MVKVSAIRPNHAYMNQIALAKISNLIILLNCSGCNLRTIAIRSRSMNCPAIKMNILRVFRFSCSASEKFPRTASENPRESPHELHS